MLKASFTHTASCMSTVHVLSLLFAYIIDIYVFFVLSQASNSGGRAIKLKLGSRGGAVKFTGTTEVRAGSGCLA
jgi:hypothetical protein